MPKKVTPKGKAAPAPVGETAAQAPSLSQLAAIATPAGVGPTPTEDPRAAKFYIRNIRHVPVSLRLSGSTNRRIELAPRGMRGDMSSVSDDEMYDQILLGNVGYTHEVITAETAREVITKQYTNAIQAVNQPSLLDMIKTEDGKDVTKVSLEKSNTESEITVGKVETYETNTNQAAENITRVSQERMVNPTQRGAHAPGSTNNPIPLVPDSIPPEQAADWLAAQDPHTYVEALRAHAMRQNNREQD